jgi:hypothetical protein
VIDLPVLTQILPTRMTEMLRTEEDKEGKIEFAEGLSNRRVS